jgi:hypothetical protein
MHFLDAVRPAAWWVGHGGSVIGNGFLDALQDNVDNRTQVSYKSVTRVESSSSHAPRKML